MTDTPPGLSSIEALITSLETAGYIATRPIATALYLAHHLRKPVLIEGPAGVGKTELAVSAARAFGFAAGYGANLDAWIDCLTYLDEPAAGMTAVHAPPGGVVTLYVDDVDALAAGAPEVFEALVDGVAFVNERRRERGLILGALEQHAHLRGPTGSRRSGRRPRRPVPAVS